MNRTTTSIKGKNIDVLTFVFFKDKVGIRLVIKNVTRHINKAQNVLERKINSKFGKSKQINTGIIPSAAAAGAGTPTK